MLRCLLWQQWSRERFTVLLYADIVYLVLYTLHRRYCGSSSGVGIATGYGLDGPGIEFR